MRKYIIIRINNVLNDNREEGKKIYNCLVRFMKPTGRERFSPTFFLNVVAEDGGIEEAKFVDETVDKKFIYAKTNLVNTDKCVLNNVIFDVSTYKKGNYSQIELSTKNYTMGLRADATKRNKEINAKIVKYRESLKADAVSKLKVMKKDYRSIESKLAQANRKVEEQKETIKTERKELSSLKVKVANLEKTVENLKELQKSKTEFSKGRDYVLNQLGLDV